MADNKTPLELKLDSTVPDSLLSKDTIDKLLSLYSDSFDDLQAIIENPLNALDADFLIEKFEEQNNIRFDDIRKELFRIHLQEIYQTFEDISDSEEVYNKFKLIYEALNMPTDKLKIVASIDKSVNSEYIGASDSFKTKKGTRSGFFFVYDIIMSADRNLNRIE